MPPVSVSRPVFCAPLASGLVVSVFSVRVLLVYLSSWCFARRPFVETVGTLMSRKEHASDMLAWTAITFQWSATEANARTPNR